MQKTSRPRLVLVLLIASMLFLAMSHDAVAQRGRVQRSVRPPQQRAQPAQPAQPQPSQRIVTKAEALKPLTAEQFFSKLAELCEKAKSDVQAPSEKELVQGKARLLKATNELLQTINKDPNRETARLWKERLGIDALKAALADAKPLEYAAVEQAWKRFNTDEDGIKWSIFGAVRTELQHYLVLQAAVAAKNFEESLPLVCTNLIQSAEKYMKTADVQDAIAVSDVLGWFDAFAPYRPRLDDIVRLVRRQFSNVNVQVQVGLPFIAAGFRDSFDEELNIVEQISGTAIRGTGRVSGTSSLSLVPRSDLVELKLNVKADMSSQTTGSHPPVTVNTSTSGTLAGTKSILFAPETISSKPAETKAALVSKTTGQRISGGLIVQSIARQQVSEKRPAAEAEARRRTERRFSDRIDRLVDGQLAELNKNYQEKVRQPLLAIGFFPKLWKFLTTEDFVNVSTIFASDSQTTTAEQPPNQDLKADVVVRVHQSALNNAAAFLGGRTFHEDDFVERFKGSNEDLPKLLQRKEGDVQINPTFAVNHPVSVSFVDNKIKVVFRIADFNLEQRQVKQQSDITFFYGIKTLKEKGTDGKERTVIAFEQLDRPRATAPGKTTISSTEMPVQRRVMTRLEESVQKRIDLQPLELKGRWEGVGKLIPAFAGTENGWLTLAWNWVE